MAGIFKHHVRSVGEAHLRRILAATPGALTILLNPRIWDKWVILFTIRCNELDAIGMLPKLPNGEPSRKALDWFIEDAVRVYARVQLEKSGEYQEMVAISKGGA